MRQLGGSFGVALVATFVQFRSWTHRVNLLSHLSIYDEPVRERIAATTRGMMAGGATFYEAQKQAYAALEGTVVRQTLLLTYMDAFRVVGIFFLCCIPLLLLFKRRPGPAPEPVSMH
jgi:DHA2 family multidrug resistance protein